MLPGGLLKARAYAQVPAALTCPSYTGMYTSLQQKTEMCAVAADFARKRSRGRHWAQAQRLSVPPFLQK